MYTAAVLAALIVPSLATDAAADFTPPRDGLLFWLDAADSATLGIEEDGVAAGRARRVLCLLLCPRQAGNDRDVRPRDEVRAAVVFDGINDVLRSETLTRQMDAWTLVAVVAPAAPIAGGGICSANPHRVMTTTRGLPSTCLDRRRSSINSAWRVRAGPVVSWTRCRASFQRAVCM